MEFCAASPSGFQKFPSTRIGCPSYTFSILFCFQKNSHPVRPGPKRIRNPLIPHWCGDYRPLLWNECRCHKITRPLEIRLL
ncbi:hypothetical protein GDO81_022066 [Engystomops pustulosus]|uniref:Uncharacterized protein n=1 Tax=Engystomops pustulosus TaxID=76066 RepID=A0AAV6ZNZ2_ENGPU|nr:hypothetical protein GDO81_022066 [Engystomops pustulosus]